MVEKTIKGFEKILGLKEYPYDLTSTDTEHFNVSKYGESVFGGGSKKLKKVVSNLYGVNPRNVCIVEGGCSNANFLVFYSLLEKGDNVLVEQPAYEPLFKVPEIFGAKIKRFERKYENNFQLDIKDILKRVNKKTKLIILTNFYNPGGVRIKEGDLKLLLKEAEKKNFYVFCDETYADPLIKKDINAVGSLSKKGISTYGLSKKYGLSTLRCGIVVANEEVIDKIIKVQFTSTAVNSGLLEKEWFKFFNKRIYKLNKRSNKILSKNKKVLLEKIISREDTEWIKPEEGSTVCVLKFKNIKSIEMFNQELEKRGVLLRALGDKTVRIGIGGNPKMFKKGILNLKETLDKGL